MTSHYVLDADMRVEDVILHVTPRPATGVRAIVALPHVAYVISG